MASSGSRLSSCSSRALECLGSVVVVHGLAVPWNAGFSQPGMEPGFLVLAGKFFTTKPTEKPWNILFSFAFLYFVNFLQWMCYWRGGVASWLNKQTVWVWIWLRNSCAFVTLNKALLILSFLLRRVGVVIRIKWAQFCHQHSICYEQGSWCAVGITFLLNKSKITFTKYAKYIYFKNCPSNIRT